MRLPHFSSLRLLLLLLLLLPSSCCLLLITAAALHDPSIVNIAWVNPLNSPSGNAINYGIPSLFGANLAVQKMNHEGQIYRNRISDLLSSGAATDASDAILQAGPAPLLPWTNLSLIICNSNSDLSTTSACSYDVITKHNAHIIVGDASSALTMQISYVSNRYGIPVLSPSATAVEFSNRNVHKNFLRIIGDIGEQTRQMAALISKYFNWHKVGIICASDAFGLGGAKNFAQAGKMEGNNIRVLTTVTFNIADTDFAFQLNRLIASNTRIIIYIGLQDDLWRLWRYAVDAYAEGIITVDLFSTGYQWVLVHSPAVPSLYINTTGGYIEDILRIIPGTIALQYPWTSPTFQKSQEFNELADRWDSSPQFLPEGFPGMETIKPSLTIPGRTFRTSTFVSGGVRGWDAVYHIGRGVAHALSQSVDPTNTTIEERNRWYEALIHQPVWKGASGEMKLNEVGDRTLGFAVLNWKRETKGWEAMGYMTSSPVSSPLNSSLPSEVDYFFNPNPSSGNSMEEVMASFEYTGSRPTVKPLDTPARKLIRISNETKSGLILAVIVICSLLLLVEIGIVLCRNYITFKAASPLFLLLFVIGVQLLCLSLLGRAFESDIDISPQQCLAEHWLTNLGYTLLVGALLVKTIRLQAIFNARILRTEQRMLTDSILLMMLTGLLLLESAMLVVLQYTTDVSLVKQSYSEMGIGQDYYSCRSTERNSNGGLTSDKLASVYLPTIITVRFVLLATTAVYAFLVRGIPDSFNESRQLLVCVYNLLFLSILLPAIDGTMGRGKENATIAYGVCVCAICILSVAIMLVPKFYEVARRALHTRPDGHTSADSDLSDTKSNTENSSIHPIGIDVGKVSNGENTKNSSAGAPPGAGGVIQLTTMNSTHTHTLVSPPFPISPRSSQLASQGVSAARFHSVGVGRTKSLNGSGTCTAITTPAARSASSSPAPVLDTTTAAATTTTTNPQPSGVTLGNEVTNHAQEETTIPVTIVPNRAPLRFHLGTPFVAPDGELTPNPLLAALAQNGELQPQDQVSPILAPTPSGHGEGTAHITVDVADVEVVHTSADQ